MAPERASGLTMYACPRCRASTISFLHKWLSWSAQPARCSGCGRSCAIAIVDASGILVVAALLITGSGFAAIATHAYWPVVMGVLSATVFYFWRQHRARLVIVTEAESKAAKKSALAIFLCSLFPGLFG